jgi:diaminopimelate epimerase
MKIKFWKMTGAGNDFVVLNGLPKGKSGTSLAKLLCDRRFGVGADGLIVMSRRAKKVRLDYWNADGSSAFCGNGSRCAAVWAKAQGWVKGTEFALGSNRGTLHARITGKGRAEISMPAPKALRLGRNLNVNGKNYHVHSVDTGVPHAVVFVDDVTKINVAKIGGALRAHTAFGRAGANVNFVEISKDELLIRTFERGVEDETLACGTGIVAAAFVARVLGFGSEPVKVRVRGRAVLNVSFNHGPSLEGPGVIVYSGEVLL